MNIKEFFKEVLKAIEDDYAGKSVTLPEGVKLVGPDGESGQMEKDAIIDGAVLGKYPGWEEYVDKPSGPVVMPYEDLQNAVAKKSPFGRKKKNYWKK